MSREGHYDIAKGFNPSWGGRPAPLNLPTRRYAIERICDPDDLEKVLDACHQVEDDLRKHWPSLAGRKGPSKPHQLCPQARHCAYGIFFAASDSLRPPFALYVMPGGRGQELRYVEVTLFGNSWHLYPWMLAGIIRALDVGIGKRRRRWQLEEVTQARPGGTDRRLCGPRIRQLPTDVRPDTVPISRATLLESFETDRSSPLEVRLLSPVRLLHDGRLLQGSTPVPFSILVARALDRLRGLYGDPARALLPRAVQPLLAAEAARVPIVRGRTCWVEQKDYSARFRKELRLGGMLGRLTYGRGARRFLPILQAGEILHVGKNVTSGCGRIEVVDRGVQWRHPASD